MGRRGAGLRRGGIAVPGLLHWYPDPRPYAGGGPLQFVTDFYADLARLRLGAWLLLLGPATLVLVWRVLVAYAWPRVGP
jgi:hypothetical protein